MGDFLSWCVQNGFLSKEASEEPQSQDEGKRIDFWSKLSPQQKESLSRGLGNTHETEKPNLIDSKTSFSDFALGNTHEAEKSIPSQIDRKFKPSDFTVIIPERHHKQFDRDSATKLVEEHLQAVEYVKKNKKLPIEEKLEKLITPLRKLCDLTFPSGWESKFPFIEEDINIKEELDIENLIPDTQKYEIIEDTELRELGLLRIRNKNISLGKKYLEYLSYCEQVKPIGEAEFAKIPYTIEHPKQDGQTLEGMLNNEYLLPYVDLLPPRYSVSDIYKLWLPSLTQEKMKSNDLLDRILVTYTIKRALNQDEKAINKLFSLFQREAEAVSVEMAKKRGMFKRYTDDIKQQTNLLLWSMIKGFSVQQILDGLTSDTDFSIPKSVKPFYLDWFSVEVPKRLSGFPLIHPLDVVVLLNPTTPIQATTRWKPSKNAIRMFNSLSYRPSRKTNLYTWLFGTNKNPMQGRFCQKISNYLDELSPKQEKEVDEEEGYEDKIRRTQVNNQSRYTKKEKLIRTDENDPDEGIDERAIVGDFIPEAPDESKEGDHERGTFEGMMSKYKPSLLKYGISERDAIIILSCLSGERTNAEMAKEYNLHKSSIEQIIHKHKPILSKAIRPPDL